MNNAGEPFRPILVSGKEYDAVTTALPPLLEEMKRHHAERRRRRDRRTRRTASFLHRGSGAGFLGFLGFLHKLTISFREHLSTTREHCGYASGRLAPQLRLQPTLSSSNLVRFGCQFVRTQKQRHKRRASIEALLRRTTVSLAQLLSPCRRLRCRCDRHWRATPS